MSIFSKKEQCMQRIPTVQEKERNSKEVKRTFKCVVSNFEFTDCSFYYVIDYEKVKLIFNKNVKICFLLLLFVGHIRVD